MLREGDILVFRSRTLFGRIIRFFTKSTATHVGVVAKVHDTFCVFEALAGRGVQLWPIERYLQDGEHIEHCELLATEHAISRDEVVRFMRSQWGFGYASWWQLVRSFVLRRKGDLDSTRWFCSELVAGALIQAGYTGSYWNKEPASVSPGEIETLPCLRLVGKLSELKGML